MESVETDMLSPCGSLNLTTAINHGASTPPLSQVIPLKCHSRSASISPDGRTLVAVGDTNETFLYSVNGGEAVTFEKISKYMDKMSPLLSDRLINQPEQMLDSPLPGPPMEENLP
ncbi:hypothetical protein FRC03_012055 [Tulasnella sp. 419]|nr:hypothetical protein FRC03_012055 [Tulasnella sp. 419]